MMNKSQTMQRMIHWFREETGKTEYAMEEVVDFAISRGIRLPKPPSAHDILVREFSQAARDEMRKDKKTGRPYRANHCFTQQQGDRQYRLWVDIDEAERRQMVKCLKMRRDQMLNDGLQLSFDTDHWNSIHAEEEPIVIDMDFTEDIEWRKNAPSQNDKAG